MFGIQDIEGEKTQMNDFSHISTIQYTIQIGDRTESMVAIYNKNKIPTGVVEQCIMNNADNKYILKMSATNFVALFLDDQIPMSTEDRKVETNETEENND